MIPRLQTDRLDLGPLSMAHVAAFTAFVASDRSRFIGGPSDDPRDAWDSCLTHAGQWQVRGYGALWANETATGRPVARVSLWHPAGFAEPELSWVVYEGCEGHGYAGEAATALRGWAAAQGLGPLVSYIRAENARSVALARRLGATEEGPVVLPTGASVTAWRHPLGAGR